MIKDGWNGFNVLHHAASRVGGFDLGFASAELGAAEIFEGCRKGEIKLAYLLGADEFDMSLLGEAFVVYQGHHGDAGAHRADVVLPGAAYTEKDGTYVNLEGRVQLARRAVFPPGQAKEDWAILRALTRAMGRSLPYDTLAQLRERMLKIAPHFAHVGEVTPAKWVSAAPASTYRIEAAPLAEFMPNFYMTDPISRASKTMAECTRIIAGPQAKKVA